MKIDYKHIEKALRLVKGHEIEVVEYMRQRYAECARQGEEFEASMFEIRLLERLGIL